MVMKAAKTGTINSKIKRGDQVVFIAGKEYNRYDSAGKRQPYRGKVIDVDARNGKVKVEGAMIVKRHTKPVPQLNREGGIREKEAWVDISNIALIDPDTGKPTRVKFETRDGKKVRVAASGKVIAETGWAKKEAKKQIEDEEPAEAK
jgi:large subunit ribosomal protein L24